MGTRIEDQPPEHWAGPESLDPTPVWKQFLLIGLFLVFGLVLVGVVAWLAVAPQIVTPPAVVPGDRLVLLRTQVPPVGEAPRLVGSPLLDDDRAFYLVQPEPGQVLAFRARWAARAGEAECRILPAPGRPTSRQFVASACGATSGDRGAPLFDLRGASENGFRGLDQYLVSMSDDRIIVNLSRLIVASERTAGPVPEGLPQPQRP